MKSRIKSLASDTMVYGVFTIVGRFITFMLTPLYTNYLGVREVGDITYIFSIIAFLNIVYSFGFDSAYFRFFDANDQNGSKKVFSHSYLTILTISGMITLSIILFSGSIAPAITDLKNGSQLIVLAAFIPFLDSLMTIPYSFLRMNRRAARFSLTRFVLIIVAVVLNVLFVVFLRWGAPGVLLAQVLANLTGVMIFLPEIKNNITFKLDFHLFKAMFKFGIPTVPAMISGMILQVADRPILKLLTDSKQVALYSVNYRLGIPMMLLVAVFEYAWKPFYLSRYQDSDAKQMFSRILSYFTFICALVFLVTGFFIEFIVRMPFVGGRFINPSYWSGLGIIPIILGGYYFNGVFNNFAAGFHIEKKTKYLPLAVGAGAIANVILNFVGIPIFGIWGAAWATFIAYLVSAIVLYYYSRKIYPMKYEWFRLLKIIFLCAMVYFAVVNISTHLSLLWKFIVSSIGVILFVALSFLLKIFNTAEIKRFKNLFQKR